MSSGNVQIEKMKEIAKLKAKEERRRLESEVSFASLLTPLVRTLVFYIQRKGSQVMS